MGMQRTSQHIRTRVAGAAAAEAVAWLDRQQAWERRLAALERGDGAGTDQEAVAARAVRG
jgi:hypothetical protein